MSPLPTLSLSLPLPLADAANASASATAPTNAPSVGKTFDVDCTLTYLVNGPTDFLFQIHALNGPDQRVLSESLVLTPPQPVHIFADPVLGQRFLRVQMLDGPFELHYQAQVQRTPWPVDGAAAELPIAQIPDDLLHYLMPTRYCESDLLSQDAQTLFGGLPHGHARVAAICDWIHNNVDYEIGTTTSTTTARDVFVHRRGVCRDFAHLGVTFCRALNIPARLVVGYANFDEPPPDFHAVFEAYLGGSWVLFDATRMSPLDDLVRIASGRDAKDVAFAMIYGPATMTRMNPCVRPAG